MGPCSLTMPLSHNRLAGLLPFQPLWLWNIILYFHFTGTLIFCLLLTHSVSLGLTPRSLTLELL